MDVKSLRNGTERSWELKLIAVVLSCDIPDSRGGNGAGPCSNGKNEKRLSLPPNDMFDCPKVSRQIHPSTA